MSHQLQPDPPKNGKYQIKTPGKGLLGAIFISAAFLVALPMSVVRGQVGLRVEPPNWWTGMINDTVQIMLYGNEVGLSEAKVKKYPGVQLSATNRVKNPNYLFLDIVISDKAEPGALTITLIRPTKEDTAITFPMLQREPESPARLSVTSRDVIYLITPDRFANGNPANDEVIGMKEGLNRADMNGRHGGDIEGIRQHLPYLQELGITALWINPMMENDMPAYSYHGYAITDFYKTDPRFGSNEDYRKLTKESQAAGIKMVMDMVLNHCGSHHWWMKDLPDDEWITHTGQPYTETNHKKTALSDPYASREDRDKLVAGWFVRTMPDLNTMHKLLSKYLIINTIWWIEYAGINGIRMDTYPYPDKYFMQKWAERVGQEYPGFFIVGEVWHYQPGLVAYWQGGNHNQDGYDSALPAVFDFPLQGAIHAALSEPEEWESGLHKLYETVAMDFLYPDPDKLVTFADNHDMRRIFSAFDKDLGKTKNALAFLITFRGIPNLYYGTEILMDPVAKDAHGAIRTDFPGGWPGDSASGFTGESLSEETVAFRDWLGKLLNWRKSAKAVHEGDLVHYVPEGGNYVFFRSTDSEKLLVVIRKTGAAETLDITRFSSMLEGHRKGRDVLTGKEYDLTASELNLGRVDEPLILTLE